MCKIRMIDARISGKQIVIMRIVTMMGMKFKKTFVILNAVKDLIAELQSEEA
jgi:hypothetical protein